MTTFIGYDLNHLRDVVSSKIDELMKKHLVFREDWIKNRRCPCVDELREGITINCKHYNKAIKKEFEKEEKEIKKIGAFIIAGDLYNNPNVPNEWLRKWKL